ncbi:hypothetical protein RK21_02066 [Pseudomonas plecoglossicida]|nr:hypothetical protein RK21_02066 [Pseudomonas plecoglossicida]
MFRMLSINLFGMVKATLAICQLSNAFFGTGDPVAGLSFM